MNRGLEIHCKVQAKKDFLWQMLFRSGCFWSLSVTHVVQNLVPSSVFWCRCLFVCLFCLLACLFEFDGLGREWTLKPRGHALLCISMRVLASLTMLNILSKIKMWEGMSGRSLQNLLISGSELWTTAFTIWEVFFSLWTLLCQLWLR